MHSNRYGGPPNPAADYEQNRQDRQDRKDGPAESTGPATGTYRQGPHGGEILRAAARVGVSPSKILDFSSNTNVFGLPITERLFAATPYHFTRYPDAGNTALTAAIARHEGLSNENVLCGNGAADLIWLVLRVLAPKSALLLGPAFSEYVRACEALGIEYSVLETRPEEDFACTPEVLSQIWESRPELAIVCSPNNPGGLAYPNLQSVISAVRSPRILVDLSYREFLYGEAEYRAHFWSVLNAARNRGCELLGLHSFTKFFCCPGIRLGYLTGEAKQIAALARQAPAWSVSQFAQDMGAAFLEHIEEYRAGLRNMRAVRHEFGMHLRRSAVFDPDLVLEGMNFFCCGLSEAHRGKYSRHNQLGQIAPAARTGQAEVNSAGDLQRFLLFRGLLVRDCDNIPGMPPGFVRIQVRGPEDNETLVDAINRV